MQGPCCDARDYPSTAEQVNPTDRNLMGNVSIESSRLPPWTMLNETTYPSSALLVVASGWPYVLFSEMTLKDDQEPLLEGIRVHTSIIASQEASSLIEAE